MSDENVRRLVRESGFNVHEFLRIGCEMFTERQLVHTLLMRVVDRCNQRPQPMFDPEDVYYDTYTYDMDRTCLTISVRYLTDGLERA